MTSVYVAAESPDEAERLVERRRGIANADLVSREVVAMNRAFKLVGVPRVAKLYRVELTASVGEDVSEDSL